MARRTTAEIAGAIARKLGVPELAEVLAARASGSQLRSLLMHAVRERAHRLRAPALLSAFRERALFAPATADGRALHRVDGFAFAAAGGFEAIDVGPVQPLGTSWVLGGIDPNSVMSTIAGAEIAGDPTSALVFTAAERRRSDGDAVVRLCTSTRVMRLQPFDNPSFTPHFRIFALVSAGRDRGDEAFEHDELTRHIEVYLRLLADLAAAGFATGRARVQVTDMRLTGALARAAGVDPAELRRGVRAHAPVDGLARFAEHGIELPARVTDPAAELAAIAARYGVDREVERVARVADRVLAPLAAAHPGVPFEIDPVRLEGAGYYRSFAFRVEVDHPSWGWVALGDGGMTDWTARLAGNRKERMCASGIGTELLARSFGP